MRVCLICRFEAEDDDVASAGYMPGTCICLRCWHREVDDEVDRARTARNAVSPVAKEVRRLLGAEGGPH